MPTTLQTKKRLTIKRKSLEGITSVGIDLSELRTDCRAIKSLADFQKLAATISPADPDHDRFNSYWDQRAIEEHDTLEAGDAGIQKILDCYRSSRPGSCPRRNIYGHLKSMLIHLLKEMTSHEEFLEKCPNVFREVELWELAVTRGAELWVKSFQEYDISSGKGESPSYTALWKHNGDDARGLFRKEALRIALVAAIDSGEIIVTD